MTNPKSCATLEISYHDISSHVFEHVYNDSQFLIITVKGHG